MLVVKPSIHRCRTGWDENRPIPKQTPHGRFAVWNQGRAAKQNRREPKIP